MDSIRSVCFSPDGTRIVSGDSNRTVKVWAAANGNELHTLTGQFASYSPDGKWIATGQHDGTVKVWNATTGK